MMNWYMGWLGKIEPVEIKSATDKTVTLACGRRQNRDSWQVFAPTWEEVRQSLLAEAEDRVMAARRQLELAQGTLGNIKGMKDPNASPAQRGG